jgi:hypothetical protein
MSDSNPLESGFRLIILARKTMLSLRQKAEREDFPLFKKVTVLQGYNMSG